MLQRSRGPMMLALATLAAPAAGQFSEVEPNDTKAQATVISGLEDGGTISGTFSWWLDEDWFLLETPHPKFGIFEHSLSVNGGIPTTVVGGLRQIDPGPGLWGQLTTFPLNLGTVWGSDAVWYGLGTQSTVYNLVLTWTPGDYTLTLNSREVTPQPLVPASGSSFAEGVIRFDAVLFDGLGERTAVTALHVFDENLQPILGYQTSSFSTFSDGYYDPGLERHFDPGTYYIAIGNVTAATSLPSPPDDAKFFHRTDFASAYFPGGGYGRDLVFDLEITDGNGQTSVPIAVTGGTVGADQQALWYVMQVGEGGGDCVAPSIASGPLDTFVCAANDALFSVTADGTGPFTYQWRLDGLDIPGANAAELLIAGADSDDMGAYDVVVTNGCGSAASNPAWLDVSPSGPEILSQPQPQTLCPGEVATFSVVAQPRHGGALSYQWLFNGAPIPGADSATYEFVVGDVTQDGVYSVQVCEENCGCSDSFPAALTVRNDPPVIALNGPQTLVLECGVDTYTEQGANVTDDCDGSVPLVIGGDVVDTHQPGVYTITYEATDSQGNAAATVERYVNVEDRTAPSVTASVAEPVLWSPNHELVDVGLSTLVQDDCDPTAGDRLTLRVYCDEVELPDTGDGTGKHSPDAKDFDLGSLRLRSERQGRADGRVYLIMVAAADASGNVGYDFATVVCPHSQDQDALDLALAQAAAITSIADGAVVTSGGFGPAAIEQAILDAGFVLHGFAPPNGPHQ